MAIGAGSKVALKIGAGLTIGQVSAQPLLFGIAESAMPGPINWDNGSHVASVAAAAVDEIVAAAAPTLALLGKVVCPTNFSSAYNAVVIAAYNRGSALECVQLQLLSNGAYLEAAASSVAPVSGL